PGSASHVYGELFKMMAGVDLVAVHYRGSAPALTDLMAGQLQVMFDPLPSSIAHIRTGRLRPLAVTTATRGDALPDIPTVSAFVPGYEASTWGALGAPRNSPSAIIGRLNEGIKPGLADQKIKARFADLGCTAMVGSSGDFRQLMAEETEKWGKVIRAANIRTE